MKIHTSNSAKVHILAYIRKRIGHDNPEMFSILTQIIQESGGEKTVLASKAERYYEVYMSLFYLYMHHKFKPKPFKTSQYELSVKGAAAVREIIKKEKNAESFQKIRQGEENLLSEHESD